MESLIQGTPIDAGYPFAPSSCPFELDGSIYSSTPFWRWITEFEKTDSYTWNAERQTIEVFEDLEGHTFDYCLNAMWFRAFGNKITFETKIKSNAETVINPEVDVHYITEGIGITGFKIENGHLVGDAMTFYLRSLNDHLDEDWTKFEVEFPELANYLIIVQAVYQAVVYYPLHTPWTWGDDNIKIRNIVIEPPSLMVYPFPVGRRYDVIDNCQNFSLTAGEMSLWEGYITRLLSSPELRLIVNGLKTGISKNYLEAAGLALKKMNPAYVWELKADDLHKAKVIYTLTLTGQASPYLPDIEIPMTSFRAIMKQGGATTYELDIESGARAEQISNLDKQLSEGYITEDEYNELVNAVNEQYLMMVESRQSSRPSYLSCVIPNSVDYAEAIAERKNGEMIIRKGYLMPDGQRNLEEIARANFDYLMIDRGANSDSVTITGYKVRSYKSPKSRRVHGVTYYGVESSGRKRIRAAIDLFLRPNDICVYGDGLDDCFVVGQITYNVTIEDANMEVVEQDEIFPED